MDELIGVPVVGAPVVAGAGFIALLLVVFTKDWAGSWVTVVHEGGHMVTAVLSFRGFTSWEMDNGDNAGTMVGNKGLGVSFLVVAIAGYLSPPLVGLGLAAVLAAGNAWGVLAVTLLVLALSFLYAKGGLANVVTAVLAAVVVLVLWRGSTALQLAIAAGAVWLLLLGGVRAAWGMALSDSSDAAKMTRVTWIPRVLWKLFWIVVSLVCLYAGGRLLFTGTAWPAGLWPFDVQA